MAKVKRIVRGRRLSPEEAAKYRRIREQVAAELPEIQTRGRRMLATSRAAAQIFQELKSVRKAKGLSLADAGKLTGMDRSFISKLETGVYANFTVQTLERYAQALGKHVAFSLVNGEAE